MNFTIEDAERLLREYTKNDFLLKHAFSVKAAMEKYSEIFNGDKEKWGIAGLLHDFDYEKFPDDHPYKGAEILRKMGVDEDIVKAILSHASYTGVPRETDMARALFAIDELTGLILAVSFVMPDKSIKSVKVKSVKKKLKDKAFAKKVNREEIYEGVEELGVDLTSHIETVLNAMKEISDIIEGKSS